MGVSSKKSAQLPFSRADFLIVLYCKNLLVATTGVQSYGLTVDCCVSIEAAIDSSTYSYSAAAPCYVVDILCGLNLSIAVAACIECCLT